MYTNHSLTAFLVLLALGQICFAEECSATFDAATDLYRAGDFVSSQSIYAELLAGDRNPRNCRVESYEALIKVCARRESRCGWRKCADEVVKLSITAGIFDYKIAGLVFRLSNDYLLQGLDGEAEKLLRKMVALDDSSGKITITIRRAAFLKLGEIYLKHWDFKRALSAYNEAAKFQLEMQGAETSESILPMLKIAGIHNIQGEYAVALKTLERLRSVNDAVFNLNSSVPIAIDFLEEYSKALLGLSRYREARLMAERAVRIRMNIAQNIRGSSNQESNQDIQHNLN